MKISYGDSKKVIDYIFWIGLILFTNPGGILQAFGEDSGDGGINVSDMLFGVLTICFIIVFNKKFYNRDQIFKKILFFLFVFLTYYVIVFGFFVPQFKNAPDYSLFKTLIKIRHGYINILLVPYIYIYYLRSFKIFFPIFIFSSIIILTLFIFSIVSGVEVLPLKTMDRRFISIDRLFMQSYGLMPLLMSMGTVLFVFKFKVGYKKWILIGFLLMSLTWVLSLLRREIFGAIILFFITAIISNYIYKKNLVPVNKILLIIFQVVIILFIVKLSFPKYIDAVGASVEQTYHVFKYGETVSGKKDTRLGFGKKELQEKIVKNYIVGTGFDNNWRVSEEAGFEASDYPFLAAIAMVGIIGMLFFLPIYYWLYKLIFRDLKYLRKKGINLESLEDYILIFLIVYFLFDIMNYTYWFLPVSLFTHAAQHKWYILLAIYIAARRTLYFKEFGFKFEKKV